MGLQQFSGKTVKELGLVVKDYRQRSRGIVGDAPTDETHSPRELRWARTTTDVSINGLYPSAPATKFIVEFGELEFDDADVGNETATFTAYDPREVRVAYSPHGWIPENTVVEITWHHGRWHISHVTARWETGKLDGTMSFDGTVTVSVWRWDGSAMVDTGENIEGVRDWLLASGQTIASGTRVVIEQHSTGQWFVTGAQCP